MIKSTAAQAALSASSPEPLSVAGRKVTQRRSQGAANNQSLSQPTQLPFCPEAVLLSLIIIAICSYLNRLSSPHTSCFSKIYGMPFHFTTKIETLGFLRPHSPIYSYPPNNTSPPLILTSIFALATNQLLRLLCKAISSVVFLISKLAHFFRYVSLPTIFLLFLCSTDFFLITLEHTQVSPTLKKKSPFDAKNIFDTTSCHLLS